MSNNIVVAEANPITDIPNDIDVPQPEPPKDPVVIPDAVADEIFEQIKIDKQDDLKVAKVEEQTSKTGTCNLCGKTMLIKNLKYAHPKVCKNRPPPEAPPEAPPSIEQVESIIAKRIKEVITKPTIEDLKHQKAEVRKQRIKSLIEQAFQNK